MKRPNLQKIGIEKEEETKDNGIQNVFNKITEENFYYIKEMPGKIQEAYGNPNRLKQKRKSIQHIIIKTLNVKNKNIKYCKGNRSSNI